MTTKNQNSHMAIPGAHIRAGRGSEPVGRQGPETSPKCWYMYGPCWATAISKLMFPNKYAWYPPLKDNNRARRNPYYKPLKHSMLCPWYLLESSGNYWRQRTLLREQSYCTFYRREWPRNQTRVGDDTSHPRYRTHAYTPIYTLYYKPHFTLSSRNKQFH